jgi:hypothetical protein
MFGMRWLNKEDQVRHILKHFHFLALPRGFFKIKSNAKPFLFL